MNDDALAHRVARLESRVEINELLTRYSIAIDDRDLDALAELFTSDAWFDSVGGRTTGREQLVAYYAERLRAYGPTYHIPHTQMVEFDDEGAAHGVVLAHAELSIEGVAFVVAMRYHDEYAREDGRWRFRSRRLDSLYAMPLAELPDGMGAALRKRWPGTDPAPAEWPEPLPSFKAFTAMHTAS